MQLKPFKITPVGTLCGTDTYTHTYTHIYKYIRWKHGNRQSTFHMRQMWMTLNMCRILIPTPINNV